MDILSASQGLDEGRGLIYALSDDETRSALTASRPASTVCFPASSNAAALPVGNSI